MARFGFCAASSLIWGWGFAVPFYSVQDGSRDYFEVGCEEKKFIPVNEH